MRTTTRRATFETNSSSVHALVHLSSEAYDYWRASGAVLLLDAALDGAPAYTNGVHDGIEASDYVVGKEAYALVEPKNEGDFTYEGALALARNTDPWDDFSEESMWCQEGRELSFYYFES